jgi:hypothetical protein
MAGEPWDPVERDRRYASAKRDGLTRLLTEGDSWFDYPPHPNIVDWLESEGQWAIKRLEKSGDTIENVASSSNLSMLSRIATKEKPVCILLSGGGNDLFVPIPERPDLKWIFRLFFDFDPGKSPAEHLNPVVWNIKLTEFRLAYSRLIGALGSLAPIIIHGYDYLIPSGERVKYDGFRVAGPFIRPSMEARGIVDPVFQREIIVALIDGFNEVLAALERAFPTSVIYVDLRGTLDPDRDWMNELHPTEQGFRVVEQKLASALRNRLPAVLQARAANS